ncbi:MAG: nitroreductase [Rhodoferax sp.]|uniref:nitroreductase family protein n=1 Tax=Rhodoferax sp. TaxID=50421 RepID=UPI00262C24D2|nr:nitroreductase [Rhodoferax sp.]MDD5336636.1 nitroreductase [Rhodoferax sp.]
MHWNEHQEPLGSALTLIHTRQSTSSRFLGEPGPDRAQIETILDAAGAAPDHRRLTPWRLVIVPAQKRPLLGDAFAQALGERDSQATEAQLQEAREKAYRGPLLVAVIARLSPALGTVPDQERLIAAGCALQNMLLTAHAMGFGAGLLTGKSLYSERLSQFFQLAEAEQLLCFMAVGTVVRGKPVTSRPTMNDYTTTL